MKIDLLDRQPQESSREYVYRLLRANIINLNLPPGAAISELDIAGMVAVSRTPVREAFIKLSQEALLDIVPQKGTYVSLIDPDHVDESRFLRAAMEREVVKLACAAFPREALIRLQTCLTLQELSAQENKPHTFFDHDEAFHATIFVTCRKARIWTAIQQMNTHYNRVRILNLFRGYSLPRILAEHRAIVAAIAAGDSAAAVNAIDGHLSQIHYDLARLRQEYRAYFKPAKPGSGIDVVCE